MKKFGIALAVLLVLFAAGAVLLPFVVDVDRYRPTLLGLANERINGELRLGKLSLSLWGQIRVDVEGLELVQGNDKRELLSVQDAYFHIPFSSVLTGSPILTLKMNHPKLRVIQEKDGSLNLAHLLKKDAPKKELPIDSGIQTPASSGLPSFVLRSRLGLELKDSTLSFLSEKTKNDFEVSHLNVALMDLSFEHPVHLDISGALQTKTSALAVNGDFFVKALLTPLLKEGALESLKVVSDVDLKSLSILFPSLFEKKKGVVLSSHLEGTFGEKAVRLDTLTLHFADAKVEVKGERNLESKLKFAIASNEIELKPWEDFFPSLRGGNLQGTLRLAGKVFGASDHPEYDGSLSFQGVSAKLPYVKIAPVIQGRIQIQTNQIKGLDVVLKAPETHISLQGSLQSFDKPSFRLDVVAQEANFDAWMDLPTEKNPHKPSYDALVSRMIQEQPRLKALSALVHLEAKKIQAYSFKIPSVSCEMKGKNLEFQIPSCLMSLMGGKIGFEGAVQLGEVPPRYQFKTSVTNLDMKEMIASQLPLFKNSFLGKMNVSMKGSGVSLDAPKIVKGLKLDGSFQVKDAEFLTIDIAKMVREALNQAIEKLQAKLPGLGPQKLKELPDRHSEYEMISSNFEVRNGKLKAPNFQAKARSHAGIDLKGTTEVGLEDLSLDTTWEIRDTYDLTRAQGISVEQNGIRVEHLLAPPSEPVHFPVHVGCTLKAPCYSYTEVPLFLGKIALDNVGRALGKRVKKEAETKVKDLIEKHAPKEFQKSLQDHLKGLFQ